MLQITNARIGSVLRRAALLVLTKFWVRFLGLDLGLESGLGLVLEPPLRSCENLHKPKTHKPAKPKPRKTRKPVNPQFT